MSATVQFLANESASQVTPIRSHASSWLGRKVILPHENGDFKAGTDGRMMALWICNLIIAGLASATIIFLTCKITPLVAIAIAITPLFAIPLTCISNCCEDIFNRHGFF